MKFHLLLAAVFVAVAVPSFAGDGLPEVRLFVSSPASGTAVIRTPDGDLQVVRPGDLIGKTRLEVTALLPDRLEVEQTLPETADTPPRRRRLWIHRAEGSKPSRIQVLDRESPPAPLLGAPALPPPASSGEPR